MMSNGQPGYLDQGIILAHEIGHIRGEWGIDNPLGLTSRGGAEAINLENKVRKSRRTIERHPPTRNQNTDVE